MDWYYVVDRKRVGPVSDEEFRSLVKTGKIGPHTLVWNETMKDWTPFKQVKMPKPAKTVPDSGGGEKGESACSQCGRTFSREELADFSGSLVCASCKPAFVQKIKEGVSVGDMVYAGFWIRAGAKIIDGILLMVVSLIINFAAGMLLMPALMSSPNSNPNPGDMGAIMAVAMIPAVLQWMVNVCYVTWFLGRFGATPGKMACGLKVVTADNRKISYLRGFGRFWAELVSGMILCIGYLMAAFDDEKRALHDRICSTRVVRK